MMSPLSSSDSLSSSSAILDNEIIKINEERCNEILECKRQIEYWKSKLEVLEEEQERNIKLARLRLDAVGTWRCLSRTERQEKSLILAALESEEIPNILEEFPHSSSFPNHLRFDKDIFLKRVERPDFIRNYNDRDGDGERLFVPPRLRGDKQVILKIIHAKHPQVIECMSCELRDDEDVLDAILELQTLPSHFLQHFSERIRSNKRKMKQVLQHRDGGLSSLGFCAPSLRNDKEFVSQVIESANHNTEPQALRFLSHRLRSDYDIVFQICAKSGLNLKHASYDLRRNEDVVSTAVQQNPEAFRYCLPGLVKQQLLDDRAFALEVVKTTSQPNSVTKACINKFKHDEPVLLHALSSGSLEWDGLDEDRRHNDHSFLCKALERNPSLYMELPKEQRSNMDIALHVLGREVSDDVILEATERCPELLSHHDAMLAICKNWWTDVLQETLQFSPPEIRGDKTIMIEAVQNDSIAYEYCTEDLQHDRDIVVAAIESSPTVLFMVPDEFQIEHPDVVIMAIEQADSHDLWSVYDDVYDELWENRDVALAWLKAGGDWLLDDFPDEFSKDSELFLAVAEHNWDQFDYADDSLKLNKALMLKAIEFDGRIIRDVPDSLRYDKDLAMAAFSKDRRALQFYSGGEDFEFMVSFTKQVRSRLLDSHIFSSEVIGTILRKASSSPDEDADDTKAYSPFSPLSLLNQGYETVQMYKSTLSSFLGLPNDNEVQLLESASENLVAWGY